MTKRREPLPTIAIAAGAAGLLLTAGLIGFVGWEASRGRDDAVPQVTVEADSVRTARGGYVVEFAAHNVGAATAANVEIEASLVVPGAESVTSTVTLDYIPARSVQRGGIFLPADPRRGELKLRPLGYVEP